MEVSGKPNGGRAGTGRGPVFTDVEVSDSILCCRGEKTKKTLNDLENSGSCTGPKIILFYVDYGKNFVK